MLVVSLSGEMLPKTWIGPKRAGDGSPHQSAASDHQPINHPLISRLLPIAIRWAHVGIRPEFTLLMNVNRDLIEYVTLPVSITSC